MVKKGTHEPKAQTAEAYPGFISMKHLGVLLLPPGWDASPSQGYLPAVCRRYSFIHLCEERQSRVKFLVKGNNTMGEAWNPDLQIQSSRL